MTTHLFISLTPHGYGHAAMTAPVIAELRRRRPDLVLTVQTTLPEDWLRSRIDGDFTIVAETPDFGARMEDAIRVDLPRTLADYTRLHDGLGGVIAREADRLRRLQPDLVLSNISYVALAAAAEAGISGVGLSCFTWADILQGCAPQDIQAAAVVAEMKECYRRATVMLRALPGMPMSGLENVRAVGPLALRVPRQRDRLVQRLELGQGDRIGLIGFGGIGLPLPLADWPRLDGWHWLVAEAVIDRPDLVHFAETGLSFSQALAAVDVVVTKPGYGTFTECAVNGTPVLYLGRPGWPETPYLTDWLHRHARALEVSAETLFSAQLGNQLHKLFLLPDKPLVDPTGIRDSADAVCAILEGGWQRQR
jgi:hypothetical protein